MAEEEKIKEVEVKEEVTEDAAPEKDNKENEVGLKETTGEGEPTLKDMFDLLTQINGQLANMQQVQDTQIPIESAAQEPEQKEEAPAEEPTEVDVDEVDKLLHED